MALSPAARCSEPSRLPRRLRPALREALRGAGTSLLSGPFLFGPGVSRVAGRPSKRGSERKAARPLLAHLALADVGVAVAAGAERGGGVVDVDGAEALEADLRVGFVEDRAEVGLVGDVVALDEEVAGVEAEAEALAAAGQLDQLGGLVEVAAEQAFVAGGLLEQQRAASRSPSAPRRSPSRPVSSRVRAARLSARPGGGRRPAAPIPSPIRSAWVSEVSDFLRSSLSLVAQLIR